MGFIIISLNGSSWVLSIDLFSHLFSMYWVIIFVTFSAHPSSFNLIWFLFIRFLWLITQPTLWWTAMDSDAKGNTTECLSVLQWVLPYTPNSVPYPVTRLDIFLNISLSNPLFNPFSFLEKLFYRMVQSFEPPKCFEGGSWKSFFLLAACHKDQFDPVYLVESIWIGEGYGLVEGKLIFSPPTMGFPWSY